MPTTLPARRAPSAALDDLAGFLLRLAQVYVAIASVLWVAVAIEHHLDTFAGLSVSEIILTLTDPGLPFPDSQPLL
jgi:hypothetical protein